MRRGIMVVKSLIGLLGVATFYVSLSANASLIGSTVHGCLGPATSGCEGGPTFDFFSGATKIIDDPVIEFTNTQDLGVNGSIVRSADFSGNTLTILNDGTDLVPNSLGFGGLIWSFDNFIFPDPAEIISGLTLTSEEGFNVLSYTFTSDSIIVITESYLVNDIEGNIFTASFDIQSSVVPVPPAVWLFGSGLIGLIGVARRKKA
jgi:hypothetical protein